MSVISLNDAVENNEGALAGLVCLGWEEVRAYIEIAESTGIPIVLMVGPGARASMPLEVWGQMLRFSCEASNGRYIIHLDHGKEIDEVKRALDFGFSSVMYDGSHLSLAENITNSQKMVELAHRYGASTEGEVGYVGYQNGAHSTGTKIADAQQFAAETQVDMMAVSVGNVHLQTESAAIIDWDSLEKLSNIGVPLVIHGGSGVAMTDRIRMAKNYNVRKFNIGTEIRQVFGSALRQYLAENQNEFDHLAILKSTHQPIVDETNPIVNKLWRLD